MPLLHEQILKGGNVTQENNLRPEEGAFVRAFIVPDKQDRYLTLLANPKKRSKITGQLYHHLDILPGKTFALENHDHNSDFVERLLRQKGAGAKCYLISPEQEFDQREMPLREALETLISQDSVAVACCVSGRLAYYKAELKQYILEAPQ